MAKHTGVSLRGSTYYLRLHVPKDVQPFIKGGSEILKSLGTKDQAEANLRAAKMRIEWAEKFASIRLKAKSEILPELTKEQITAIVAEEVARSLKTDEEERQRGLSAVAIEFADRSVKNLKTATAMTLSGRDVSNAVKIAEYVLKVRGYKLDTDSPSLRELAFELAKGVRKVVNAQEQRNLGEWVDTPEIAAKPVQLVSMSAPANSDTLYTVFAKYNEDRKLPQQPTEGYLRCIDSFVEFAGVKPIADYTRKDCLGFMDSLKESGRAVKTINTSYLAFVGKVFSFAMSRDLRPDNPMAGVKIVQARGVVTAGNAYSKAELIKLFSAPVFTQGERQVQKGSSKPIGEAVFWIPLIGLFTGARSNEICQLRKADVIECEHGYYFNLVHEGYEEGQRRIKAYHGRRVPVHKELIRIGFLAYLKTVPEGGNLFPDLRPDKYGKMNQGFSKWFNARLLIDLNLKESGRDFHSLRHTLKDAFREAMITEDVSDALTGHRTAASVGRMYGSGVYPLNVLFEAMQKLKPPIDLSGLKWREDSQ